MEIVRNNDESLKKHYRIDYCIYKHYYFQYMERRKCTKVNYLKWVWSKGLFIFCFNFLFNVCFQHETCRMKKMEQWKYKVKNRIQSTFCYNYNNYMYCFKYFWLFICLNNCPVENIQIKEIVTFSLLFTFIFLNLPWSSSSDHKLIYIFNTIT